jgi:hypothetical protein
MRPPGSLSRNKTIGSLQMRRASGRAPNSSAQAAIYQALRSSMAVFLGKCAEPRHGMEAVIRSYRI